MRPCLPQLNSARITSHRALSAIRNCSLLPNSRDMYVDESKSNT